MDSAERFHTWRKGDKQRMERGPSDVTSHEEPMEIRAEIRHAAICDGQTKAQGPREYNTRAVGGGLLVQHTWWPSASDVLVSFLRYLSFLGIRVSVHPF